jgi:transmembrane sensor
MDSNKQIEDKAAEWLARRDSEAWTQADEPALEEWLSASVHHEVAFLRLEAVWEEAQRLKALGAGTPSGVVPAPGQWRLSPLFERRPSLASDSSEAGPASKACEPRVPVTWHRWRLAGLLVLMVPVAVFFSVHSGGEGYRTPVGGFASIPLRDGSNVTLNTQSQIRVHITDTTRKVELEEGEAYFEVAKDSKRPFVVVSGDKRVVVVGTKFSMRRDHDDVEVVVTEGRVRLEGANTPLRVNGETAGAAVLLPGAVAHASRADVEVDNKSPRDVEDALSWRTGYLIFDATPLSGAIVEFNRYTTHPIVIEDPAVGSLPISGKFRANNSAAFTRMLHEGFGIHVQERDDATVLSRK